MKTAFCTVLVASALLAGPAMAADMAVKARPLPVVAEVYSWTGCYLGVSGGGLWAHKRWTDNDPLSTTRGLPRTNQTASGGMGGGQIGCDYQTGRFVFGIEGSYHAVDATATSPDIQFPFFLNNSSHVSGLGQVTGRIGYTVLDQALLYVRGGVAFERDRYNITSAFNGTSLATTSENRTGGIVGVGMEYLFTKNLSAFIEYDYLDMGSRDNTFLSTTRGTPFTISTIREHKDVAKIGLNYRFNWAQPVVARY